MRVGWLVGGWVGGCVGGTVSSDTNGDSNQGNPAQKQWLVQAKDTGVPSPDTQ